MKFTEWLSTVTLSFLFIHIFLVEVFFSPSEHGHCTHTHILYIITTNTVVPRSAAGLSTRGSLSVGSLSFSLSPARRLALFFSAALPLVVPCVVSARNATEHRGKGKRERKEGEEARGRERRGGGRFHLGQLRRATFFFFIFSDTRRERETAEKNGTEKKKVAHTQTHRNSKEKESPGKKEKRREKRKRRSA